MWVENFIFFQFSIVNRNKYCIFANHIIIKRSINIFNKIINCYGRETVAVHLEI